MKRTGGTRTDEILGHDSGPEGLPHSIIVTAEGPEGEAPELPPGGAADAESRRARHIRRDRPRAPTAGRRAGRTQGRRPPAPGQGGATAHADSQAEGEVDEPHGGEGEDLGRS